MNKDIIQYQTVQDNTHYSGKSGITGFLLLILSLLTIFQKPRYVFPTLLILGIFLIIMQKLLNNLNKIIIYNDSVRVNNKKINISQIKDITYKDYKNDYKQKGVIPILHLKNNRQVKIYKIIDNSAQGTELKKQLDILKDKITIKDIRK